MLVCGEAKCPAPAGLAKAVAANKVEFCEDSSCDDNEEHSNCRLLAENCTAVAVMLDRSVCCGSTLVQSNGKRVQVEVQCVERTCTPYAPPNSYCDDGGFRFCEEADPSHPFGCNYPSKSKFGLVGPTIVQGGEEVGVPAVKRCIETKNACMAQIDTTILPA